MSWMRLVINSVGWASLVLVMALGVAFAEKRTNQTNESDSSSLDSTQKPVSGYPTYVTQEPESVFVELLKPETKYVHVPEILNLSCLVCDSCYPLDLGSMVCTAVYSPFRCPNSCSFDFKCLRTDSVFSVTAYECDRIKWGFWKKPGK